MRVTAENICFERLTGGRRREFVDTQQRFDALIETQTRPDGHRGSMSFSTVGSSDDPVRSFHDPKEAALLFTGLPGPDERFEW